MPDLNPFRPFRRLAPKPLDGVLSLPEMALDDWAGLRHGIPGNDLDAWDPDYIRRVLPLMNALMGTYFRGEVRGLENIPRKGPARTRPSARTTARCWPGTDPLLARS